MQHGKIIIQPESMRRISQSSLDDTTVHLFSYEVCATPTHSVYYQEETWHVTEEEQQQHFGHSPKFV